LEAGLEDIGRITILKLLQGQSIKVYVEEYKFILDEDNKQCQVVST